MGEGIKRMRLFAPQIIYMALVLVAGGITLAKHGEPRNENYNFGIWFLSTAITLALLYWGGFFT